MNQSLDKSPSQPFIKLARFLKWQGLAQTGGEAKLKIKAGEVTVNGKIEIRRGRKLVSGDIVTVRNLPYKVELN